jgi:hypothetical protein
LRVFKTKEFARFSRKERIGDESLCDAFKRAEDGLLDADLGGGVIKQRVARPGQGRSRGYRTIIAFRSKQRSVFMHGFAKSGKANLNDEELAVYQALAQLFLGMRDAEITEAHDEGELIEVNCNGD